jgi:hypothetical protein
VVEDPGQRHTLLAASQIQTDHQVGEVEQVWQAVPRGQLEARGFSPVLELADRRHRPVAVTFGRSWVTKRMHWEFETSVLLLNLQIYLMLETFAAIQVVEAVLAWKRSHLGTRPPPF